MGTCQWTRGRAIGRGSSATVSLATAHPSGEIFAVKSSELAHSQFLQREETILTQLKHHRIVACSGHDTTTENGRQFFNLFMEYVAGGTISDAIHRNGGRIDEPMIRSYTRDILEGLVYLHSIGFAHCDIKGRNVLIGSEGAKIADLGCARLVDVSGTVKTPIAGTPLFMSPEVARGEEQRFPADVWALGCTVIEMATGTPPWPETTDPVSALYRIGYSGDVPELPSWISDEAKDFLSKCFKRKPEERWTANQLLKHPFVDESNYLQKPVLDSVLTNSPMSTLDIGFWDSFGESPSDRDLTHFESYLNSLDERIRQLGGGISGRPNWTWEENWITVRRNEESEISTRTEECQIPVGEQMGGSDSGGDGQVASSVIKERDYSSDLVVNGSCDDEGIFQCSGDDSWKVFVISCKCNRNVLFSNPDLGWLSSFLFFVIAIAVASNFSIFVFTDLDSIMRNYHEESAIKGLEYLSLVLTTSFHSFSRINQVLSNSSILSNHELVFLMSNY